LKRLLLLLLLRQLELERLLRVLLRRQLERERRLLRWQLELEARPLGRGAPPLPLDDWCGWCRLGALRKPHAPRARRRRLLLLLAPHSRHNVPSLISLLQFEEQILHCLFDPALHDGGELLEDARLGCRSERRWRGP
jgi:hypothetical protein